MGLFFRSVLFIIWYVWQISSLKFNVTKVTKTKRERWYFSVLLKKIINKKKDF